MKYRFKTNINCGGCVATITPHLDGNENIDSWHADTEHADKILEVESAVLSEKEVIAVIENAGFKAESAGKKKGFLGKMFS